MEQLQTDSGGLCALSTWDLTKRYRYGMFSSRPIYAVKNVNLCLKRGEIVALLGRNGAGKTTLLKLILGLVRPTSGGVRIFPPNHTAVRHRAFVGYAPESFHLQTNESVSTVLSMIAGLKGLCGNERRRQVHEMASQVGLQSVLDRPVGQLSKGLSRKLAIAQSLIAAPSLLLLDEPMDGLDPEGRALVRDLLKSLKHEGSSIFLCTHLLSEVEAIADQIAIMTDGRIAVAGYLQELLARQESFIVSVSGPISQGGCRFFRSGEGWVCRVDGRNSLDALIRGAKAEGKIIQSTRRIPPTIESLFLEFTRAEDLHGQT